MELKSYYIDTNPLSGEAQQNAMIYIENNAWTSSYVPHSKGCYYCEWEDGIDPALLPPLAGCIVRKLP